MFECLNVEGMRDSEQKIYFILYSSVSEYRNEDHRQH